MTKSPTTTTPGASVRSARAGADCIAFSDPSEDNSICLCRHPRVMQGDECVLCDYDTFYDESTSYCEWCPPSSEIPYTTEATDTEYDVSLCECFPGFVSGDFNHCEPCAPNTYETSHERKGRGSRGRPRCSRDGDRERARQALEGFGQLDRKFLCSS